MDIIKVLPNAIKCFKINGWKNLFINNGFKIITVKPLLLYAPSEMPYIPTTKKFTQYKICSSVLFLLNK